MSSIDEETSLLEVEESLLQVSSSRVYEEVKLYAEDGSVDINGNPPLKQTTGNWKACPFIFANECCERLAYYGIAKNLITYFANELHETNVSAARHVMTWQGTCYITPLIGALIADAYWGRYWTIACFSAIYFTGMVALTLSASVPGLKPEKCIGSICPPSTTAQRAVLLSGLYLIALGTGGIKPCVSSFGADQFDHTDPSERARKASFFNWFYFSINIGAFVSSTLLVWIQEINGWELGFLIPTVFMGLATVSFFFGTPLYRFQKPRGSPITKLWNLSTVTTQVEEVTILLRLVPIWASGIVFSVLHSQIYTLFVQQGRSMKRTMGSSSFEIPPACLGVFDTASVFISVPIYDRLIVPFARRFTGLAKGLTELQRMGIGLFVSVLSLTVAAVVETLRLRLAKDLDLELTILWQIPQYFLMGTAGVFFFVGRIEFFYEESPDSMRSLCNAWALLTTTLGNYLSSLIVTVVACLSGKDDGWIPSENLDSGHLDYFFWLLVCLGSLNIPVFVYFSVKYTQRKV
ncbi:unnamed protein product [Microthlaspi erraticum]|uniref:Major facilitator superfamily (MFS) profile domain-containing protein n=1 Tax=Microthlaspi erraticum TaxID=1685480 RepID=A0A6D2K782_9BRAS|nr:unnamed protein product [Microthlaspi erraticum]